MHSDMKYVRFWTNEFSLGKPLALTLTAFISISSEQLLNLLSKIYSSSRTPTQPYLSSWWTFSVWRIAWKIFAQTSWHLFSNSTRYQATCYPSNYLLHIRSGTWKGKKKQKKKHLRQLFLWFSDIFLHCRIKSRVSSFADEKVKTRRDNNPNFLLNNCNCFCLIWSSIERQINKDVWFQ